MDDYPTEDELARLAAWPHTDLAGALDFAASLWHWPEFVQRELRPEEALVLHAGAEDYIRFATGGWSGNESIIAAMRENQMLWVLTWRLSASGGLHIFYYGPAPLAATP